LRPTTWEPSIELQAVAPVARLSDRAATTLAVIGTPATVRLTSATEATASSSALVGRSVGVLATLSRPTPPLATGARASGSPRLSSESGFFVAVSGFGSSTVVPPSAAVRP
jgi:hypothetical protein